MICNRCWQDSALIAELKGIPHVEAYMELLVSRAVTKDLKGCDCGDNVPDRDQYANYLGAEGAD